MLDIPWVLQKLKSFGRDCNAIVEMWPPAEATLAQSMALENEWAESGIRRLAALDSGLNYRSRGCAGQARASHARSTARRPAPPS